MDLKILIVVQILLASSNNAQYESDIENEKSALEFESLTVSIVESHGFKVEEHLVTTSDGYILKMFRILQKTEANAPIAGKKVVFLQHGLLCSSADFIVLGPKRALPYLLLEAGYDVWLGNSRGNTNSRKHERLSPNRSEFWQFSWHEMGIYDLPASIDYILEVTGKANLHYVGHSQGTTAFFVMASLRLDMNSKIRSMHALAPSAFGSNQYSPLFQFIGSYVNTFGFLLRMFGVNEFLPNNEAMIIAGQIFCQNYSPFQELCANILFLIAGYSSDQLDRSLLPIIMENTPAGASTNQIIHYAQLVNSGKFRMFDHGPLRNLLRYGSRTPPDYKLDLIETPVYLHYGLNDWLVSIVDVKKLASLLGNLKGLHLVDHHSFNHLDFMYGRNADTLVYQKVINSMLELDFA